MVRNRQNCGPPLPQLPDLPLGCPARNAPGGCVKFDEVGSENCLRTVSGLPSQRHDERSDDPASRLLGVIFALRRFHHTGEWGDGTHEKESED
jgi:hypothetical protein